MVDSLLLQFPQQPVQLSFSVREQGDSLSSSSWKSSADTLNLVSLYVGDNKNTPRRMLKKAVQQGRSE
jgi:hypothetical protein